MLHTSAAVFSRGQAVILHHSGTCFPVLLFLPVSDGTLDLSHGQHTQEEVYSGGAEVRGDYKYISMFVSVRRFSSGGHAGQGEPGLIAHQENDRKQRKNLM